MPLIQTSSYNPPFIGRCAHFQTIWHSEFRRVDDISYDRQSIDTPDGDFLLLDWVQTGQSRLVILVHGLESAATRPYMRGMVKAMASRGYDCLALNLRGCGGALNRLPTFYHAGKTDDVETTVRHAQTRGYGAIYLIGFSLGGNMVLKWLGEKGSSIPSCLKAAAAVSAPCDLVSSSVALNRFSNRVYNRRFVRKLMKKVREKAMVMPELLAEDELANVRTLEEFDERFTSRSFGFDGADDYYRRCSSLPLLKCISVPTLLLNALDDPFLGPACFPADLARDGAYLSLEAPKHGGHIGFLPSGLTGEYWHELRVAEFFK